MDPLVLDAMTRTYVLQGHMKVTCKSLVLLRNVPMTPFRRVTTSCPGSPNLSFLHPRVWAGNHLSLSPHLAPLPAPPSSLTPSHSPHPSHAPALLSQAMGYGLVLLDGNVVNINRLKRLNIQRIDRIFKACTCIAHSQWLTVHRVVHYECDCQMILVLHL